MLSTLLYFLILLFFLIFVHEMGHLLAAKLVGVKVECFSLGFGPKVLSKKIGETEYQLALFPLGGFVKMYGEDPESEEKVSPELESRSFSHKSPWAKMLIVLAGPVFNLVLAVLLFWLLVGGWGIPQLTPVIGTVKEGSAAFEAGLKLGDVVTEINGQTISYFSQIDQALAESQGAALRLSVEREGRILGPYSLTPKAVQIKNIFGDNKTVYDLGLNPRVPAVIGKVIKDMPAEKAGLKKADRIVSIEGHAIHEWEDVLLYIQGPPDERKSLKARSVAPLNIVIHRPSQNQKTWEEKTFTITPTVDVSQDSEGKNIYTTIIGMQAQVEEVNQSFGFAGSLKKGFQLSWTAIEITFLSFKKIITGEMSYKVLGGPILIAEAVGKRAQDGLASVLDLAAFISINLGILNLLPVPVLDGGQLSFFIIEAVRRKPLSLKLREYLQWGGFAFLILLMVLVFYNDIARLVNRSSAVQDAQRQSVVTEENQAQLATSDKASGETDTDSTNDMAAKPTAPLDGDVKIQGVPQPQILGNTQ